MSMRSRTLIALVAGAIFGFSAAVTGGVLAERPSELGMSGNSTALPWEEARQFAEVYERIKREYVDDVDDLYERAVEAGATVLMPLQDCFWGDRYAIIRDPFGHRWSMATRIEDLSPRQLQKRASEFNAQHPETAEDSDE